MANIVMNEVSEDKYQSEDGYVMEREYGETPNHNPMNGRWVLRNPQGEMLGFDQYRYDLAEDQGLKLVENWKERLGL